MSGAPVPNLARLGSGLILKPSSMGDIVLTLPAVACLKRAFPQLPLRWLCNEEWTPLLEGNPHLAEIIPFPRNQFRGWTALPALIRWLRHFRQMPREKPEVALDFQGLLRTGLLAWLRGSETRVGLSDAREGANFFHRHVVRVDPKVHAVNRYLVMAKELGAPIPQDLASLEWPLPPGKPPRNDMPGRFILVHPFARGEGKSLSHETLAALCKTLAPQPVVLAGCCSNPPDFVASHVTSLLNQTTIAELIWLLRNARAIVSVDSGPMHLAAALQPTRTIGIHTWSDPRQVGPYDLRAKVWKAGRVANRRELSAAEAAAQSRFEAGDARRLAEAVLEIANP